MDTSDAVPPPPCPRPVDVAKAHALFRAYVATAQPHADPLSSHYISLWTGFLAGYRTALSSPQEK